MVTIEILKHVESASSYEDGGKIFALLKSNLEKNQIIELSFIGISSVPSAFINSAIIQLLEHFDFEKIRSNLKFTHTTKHINELIKSRFEFSTKNISKIKPQPPQQ